MVRKKLPIAQQLGAAELVPIEKLFLDHDNPRLADQHFSVGQQDEIIQALWQDRAVNEVLDSIAANGYWGHEILFAIVEEGKRLLASAANSGRKLKLAETAVSKIKKRQTDSFRPGSQGCLIEADYHFYVA